MDVGCTLPVGGQFKKLDCNQEGLNLETQDLCVCVYGLDGCGVQWAPCPESPVPRSGPLALVCRKGGAFLSPRHSPASPPRIIPRLPKLNLVSVLKSGQTLSWPWFLSSWTDDCPISEL